MGDRSIGQNQSKTYNDRHVNKSVDCSLFSCSKPLMGDIARIEESVGSNCDIKPLFIMQYLEHGSFRPLLNTVFRRKRSMIPDLFSFFGFYYYYYCYHYYRELLTKIDVLSYKNPPM